MSTWGFEGFKKRGLELAEGDLVDVAPIGRARLRFHLATLALQVSLSGAPYVDIGGGGSGGGWTDDGAVVRLNTITDQVVIGALVPIGTEDLRVVGDTLLQGTVEVGSQVTTQAGSGNDLVLGADSGVVMVEVGAATVSAFQIIEEGGANIFVDLDTSVGAERFTFGAGGPIVPSVTINIPDNAASGFLIRQGLNAYFLADSSNAAERIVIGNATATAPQLFLELRDDLVDALIIRQAGNAFVTISTDNGAEAMAYGNTTAAGPTHLFLLRDNAPVAFQLLEGLNAYLTVSTQDAGGELIVYGNSSVSAPGHSFELLDNSAVALEMVQGANAYLSLATTTAAEQMTYGNTTLDAPAHRFELRDNKTAALAVTNGANTWLTMHTTDADPTFNMNSSAEARVLITAKDNVGTAFGVFQAGNGYIVCDTLNGAEVLKLGTAPAGCDVLIGTATSVIGFFGDAGTAQPTITGSRGGNAALADFLTALAAMGLIIDNTVV